MRLNDNIDSAVNWDAPSINSEESLRNAIARIVESDVSSLVVKMNREVVGVLTETDVVHSIVQGDDLDETKVAGIMSPCEVISAESKNTPCIQLHEGESIESALKVINVAGIHNLLVTREHGEAGMVSIRDLLRLMQS